MSTAPASPAPVCQPRHTLPFRDPSLLHPQSEQIGGCVLGSGVGAHLGMDGRNAASLHAEAPLQDKQARRLLPGPFLRRAGKESLSTSAASQGQRKPEATRSLVLSTWREPPAPPAPAQEEVGPRQGPSQQEERGVPVSPSVRPTSNQPSSGSPVTGADDSHFPQASELWF